MKSKIKLQLALDLDSLEQSIIIIKKVINYIDIIEVGTPLIKKYGIDSIKLIRKTFKESIILADMKTIDGGVFEAEIAFKAGADIATVMACSDIATLQNVINVAKKYMKKVVIDMLGFQLGMKDFESTLRLLDFVPNDIILLTHLSFDKTKNVNEILINLKLMQEMKEYSLAIAGGINLEVVKSIIEYEPSIIVVGSYITRALDPLIAVKNIRNAIYN